MAKTGQDCERVRRVASATPALFDCAHLTILIRIVSNRIDDIECRDANAQNSHLPPGLHSAPAATGQAQAFCA
jgi:hypothetical protein